MFRTAKSIRKTIQKRIKALHPYKIFLHQIHQPFGFSSKRNEIKEMVGLMKSGEIQNVGVSNFSKEDMVFAYNVLKEYGIQLFSNQVEYSLVSRRIEWDGTLDMAQKLGIKIIAYAPLGLGILTGKFHQNPELLKNLDDRRYSYLFKPKGIAETLDLIEIIIALSYKHNTTPGQIALNWVIQHDNVYAIPGAKNIQQALSNANSMKFNLLKTDIKLFK